MAKEEVGNAPNMKKAKLDTQPARGLVVATIPSGILARETEAGSVQRNGLNIQVAQFVLGRVEKEVVASVIMMEAAQSDGLNLMLLSSSQAKVTTNYMPLDGHAYP